MKTKAVVSRFIHSRTALSRFSILGRWQNGGNSCDSNKVDEDSTSFHRHSNPSLSFSRTFSSLNQGPTTIDYRSVLQEDEFHKLANSTIQHLQEKLEEYGDVVQIDGFDVDYGNEVLTVKLGESGTYVLNKQTPNRQLWLSSPVSGPSRFDWDEKAQAWIYRRTKAKLVELLESEVQKLCGEPIVLA